MDGFEVLCHSKLQITRSNLSKYEPSTLSGRHSERRAVSKKEAASKAVLMCLDVCRTHLSYKTDPLHKLTITWDKGGRHCPH